MSIFRKFGKLQKSDKKLFAFLYEEYYYKAFNVARRITRDRQAAEDIAHEAFERAFENFNRFNSIEHFSRWLVVTSTNLAIDELKRSKPCIFKEDLAEDDNFVEESDASPELMYLREEHREEILEALNSLKPIYSIVLYLRYYCDFSYAEMAKTLEVSENTLRLRCFRALRQLKEKLHQPRIRRVK
jgi:RNA polymerase sigma-70 factor, ECF subfamily